MSKPLDQISTAFDQGHPAFMPYFTLGYPDYETSLAIVQALAEGGADLIELGLPFSDPLADGPTIQHSTQVALRNGMNLKRCLDAVRELRARGVEIPFMLMGYFNPIVAFGVEAFATAACEVGANGFIVPDLPPEEAEVREAACQRLGLGLAFLLAPTSTTARIKLVTEKATGFTYLVALTGITGARAQLSDELGDFVARVRQVARTPLAVGFGISTPEQARTVGAFADGVIVGSKLINIASTAADPVGACRAFVEEMVSALHTAPISE